MLVEQKTDINTLLNTAAMGLRSKGEFSSEFSSRDWEQMVRKMVEQSGDLMKANGVTATINQLNVAIRNGAAEARTVVVGSKKIGFMNASATITAEFQMANVLAGGQPSGELETTRLNVSPENLFGLVRPRKFLAPYLEGKNVNKTLRELLGTEMQKRRASFNSVRFSFTPENTLRIDLKANR